VISCRRPLKTTTCGTLFFYKKLALFGHQPSQGVRLPNIMGQGYLQTLPRRRDDAHRRSTHRQDR
jgi:hypothetical protein